MKILEALRTTTESIKTWAENNFLTKEAATVKLTYITILSTSWIGDSNLWSQVVVCSGVTVNSKLDLQPTPSQIIELQDAEISLMATNEDGVITVYAIGNKPTSDMTIQVLITEVAVV